MKTCMIFLTILLISIASYQSTIAQVKIDLKTEFLDKNKEMQAVKAGITGMIKQDIAWLKVVEVGEKYSVWVKNLQMLPKQTDPMISVITFDLELRTPAMFSNGKLVSTSKIQFEFDSRKPLPFDNPPQLERTMDNIKKSSETSMGMMAVEAISTLGLSAIARITINVGAMLQSKFTPVQSSIGVLSGYYTIGYLYKMLKEQNEFPK